MVDIPPPVASSAAGAPLQARDAAEIVEARRAGQQHAIRRQAQSMSDAGATVETTDADARVFSDTEGTGSQGRELGDQDTGGDAPARQKDSKGITIDADGQMHLDLEA
jgi:hypothetical protein